MSLRQKRQKRINDFLARAQFLFNGHPLVQELSRDMKVWARAAPPVPEEGSQADEIAVRLFKLAPEEIHYLWGYIARKLPELTQKQTPLRAELRLGRHDWHKIGDLLLDAGSFKPGVDYVRSRLDSTSARVGIKAALGLADTMSSLFLSALADMLTSAIPNSKASLFPWDELVEGDVLLELIGERLASGRDPDLNQKWKLWLRDMGPGLASALCRFPQSFGEFMSAVTDREIGCRLLSSADVDLLVNFAYWQEDFFRKLLSVSSEEVLRVTSEPWKETEGWVKGHWVLLKRVIFKEPEFFHNRLSVQLGYEAALKIHETGADPRDPSAIPDFWQEIGAKEGLEPVLERQTRLWAAIRALAAYEERSWNHSTELTGARDSALTVAQEHPEEWARALPWLLARAHLLGGFVEATTLILAAGSEPVRDALQQTSSHANPSIRDRARGIEALQRGVSSPQETLVQNLLAFAARLVDGAAAFPHPLEPMSSTWIGSLAVEQILRSTVETGHRRFIPYFLDQGGIEEEAVTSRLLSDLEFAFSTVRIRVNALGTGTGKVSPKIEFMQKQVPKKDEETYGCDLALLVRGRVPGALQMESTELVQVKKPESRGPRGNGASFREAWRVDTKQLADLLEWSQTAAYWLIHPGGEVFVAPARLLRAILQEKGKLRQGTAVISYEAIRSMAVPLRQFLVDLVIGIWIGTSRIDTLRFARGEVGTTRPRHIVEIKVEVDEKRG